jgi:uncharacterized protein HemY
MYWNSLGVAAYRDGNWSTAHDSLQKSISLSGGKAHDWFFLAMTHWNQGKRTEAIQSFDMAVGALKNESKADLELQRFHTEAAKLLGLPCPKPEAGVPQSQ